MTLRAAPAALLAPRSIAIVGASDDAGKTASRPLRFLRAGGYGGAVYPVARRATVLGERAWPSLSDLPERPDHVFVLLPTEAAMEAVAECVRLGVPAVTVLAGGFSETGAAGLAREAALRRMLQGSGTRLLGPNSIGLVNVHAGMTLTANAAFAEAELPRGGVFVASQSGSMIGAIMSRGRQRGLGFAGLVSVGAEVDLDIGSVCAATLDDPAVTSYMLFLETLRGAEALRAFAVEAAARGKPMVAYKLGRSAEAAALAESHTGALAGADDVAAAFLLACGIARVDTLEGLLEAPALLHRLPIRRRRQAVGVVTTTGGGAAMVVDQLGIRGVGLAPMAAATRDRLAAAGIDPGHAGILDLTLAGARPAVMRAALEALLDADEFDLVIAVVGSSARLQPEIAVQAVVEAQGGLPGLPGRKLAAFCVPDAPAALAMLAAAGVPAFRTPEACADAVAAAFGRRPPQAGPPSGATIAGERRLDEAEAYALLAGAGVPHAPFVVLAADHVGEVPAPFGYPVAVKALHAELGHKSDVGGVALGVGSAAGVRAAAAEVVRLVGEAGVDVDRMLVQAMVPGLGEALIGYRRDPMVGQIVVLAAGGLLTEVYRDRSVRMAPVDLGTAREMIAEVRGLRALEGFRGRPPGDMGALAAAVVALSRLGDAPGPMVLECEVNPLMVMADGQGVAAVDAVARVASG